MDIVELVNQFGLPIVIAGGLGYFIFFIWKFVTTQIKPKLGSTATVLIALIERIRMLDNDLIRLDQKLNLHLVYLLIRIYGMILVLVREAMQSIFLLSMNVLVLLKLYVLLLRNIILKL